MLRDVVYREGRRVTHHIVIRWRPDLTRKRHLPWFPMTDPGVPDEAPGRLYARRKSVEGPPRDTKSRRDGRAVRHTKFRHAGRLDRPLLIPASV